MTDSIEQPRFIPWFRRGLAAHITTEAELGMATETRAAAEVTVTARGSGQAGQRAEEITSPAISLAGPGDVIGFNQTEVIRRYPVPGADDAEPNYFVHIEFSSPDFPWRYTPAANDTDNRLQPWLMLIVVPDEDGFALAEQQNGRLPVLHIEQDAASHLPAINQSWAWVHTQADIALSDGVSQAYDQSPDSFRSRLLCPRFLEPNRSWIACLVPTFEVGRLAGLGRSGPPTRSTSWTDDEDGALDLPVYSSWRFTTGQRGDFESLVRRLKARTLPGSVGRRQLDLTNPGGGLSSAKKAFSTYEGALVSPVAGGTSLDAAHRDVLAAELTERINATAVKRQPTQPYHALDDDPVIGPPAYGAPQAHRRTIPEQDKQPPYWFRQLNTEPHRRASAALGTEVVRNDQEALMAVAWDHLGDTVEINRVLGRARLAWEVGVVAKEKLGTVSDDRLIQLAGPALHRCAVEEGQTLRGAVLDSDLPTGLISGAMRRLSHNVAGMTVLDQGEDDGPLVKYPMTDVITSVAIADPTSLVSKWSEIKIPPGTNPTQSQDDPPASATPGIQPSEFPKSGGQTKPPDLTGMDLDVLNPMLARLQNPQSRSVQIGRPKTEIGVHHKSAAQSTDSLAQDIRATIDPPAVVKAMVTDRVTGLTVASQPKEPVPVRVTSEPLFTTPMYRRLAALSVDYLVPGIGEVPDDTLGLLEVNRPFIEAFLTGLNHEMSRELLWREYPSRLDRTWFRQFWDTTAADSYDITPIGRWQEKGELGANRPRTTAEVGLVLLIKGALPRRYPDLRVYAVEAEWKKGSRRENTSSDAVVHQPLFTGTLGTGVYFYGFAVTEAEANGSTASNKHPGYFFVLEEQAGKPRFGMDVARPNEGGSAPNRWSNLRWSHLRSVGDPIPTYVDTDGPSWLTAVGAIPGNGGSDSWGDDSAAMARITLQRPVRMLVHASAMLPDGNSAVASLERRVVSRTERQR